MYLRLPRPTRSIVTSVAHLVRSFRRFGWRGVGKRIAYYGCTHDWMLGLADVQVLGLMKFTPMTESASLTDYLFLLASPADLEAILLCSPAADRVKLRKLFLDFFAGGFRCAIARHNDAVIGYNWAFTGSYTITVDDYRHHAARIELHPGTAFTGNAYVKPDYRGRGVIRQLKSVLFSHFPTGTQFYTAVSDLNLSSLRANTHLGFEKLATLRFTRSPFGNRLYLKSCNGDRWSYIGPAASAVQLDGREVRAGERC